MPLSQTEREKIAAELVEAEASKEWIPLLTHTHPNADISDAYAIGQLVTATKVVNGNEVKGHKVGLTSKAMRQMTGATEPDYGTLFDNWFVPEGSVVSADRFNRALVEVEIAFVLKRDLTGPGVNAADVISATDYVLPAIEIVDSRYSEPQGSGIVDSIADAASCGLVVLGGNPVQLAKIDIRQIGASLFINGEVEVSGMASAVMGNPVNSVAWLANKLAEFDIAMRSGHCILSGSFTKAVPFSPGDTLSAQFNKLGSVTIGLGD
jgi:2-oxo-hept-3-ene-1,7-dioate hydratase/2-keto-4-pentenoate hydratase